MRPNHAESDSEKAQHDHADRQCGQHFGQPARQNLINQCLKVKRSEHAEKRKNQRRKEDMQHKALLRQQEVEEPFEQPLGFHALFERRIFR